MASQRSMRCSYAPVPRIISTIRFLHNFISPTSCSDLGITHDGYQCRHKESLSQKLLLDNWHLAVFFETVANAVGTIGPWRGFRWLLRWIEAQQRLFNLINFDLLHPFYESEGPRKGRKKMKEKTQKLMITHKWIPSRFSVNSIHPFQGQWIPVHFCDSAKAQHY